MHDRPSLMIPQLGSDPASDFPDPATAMESPDGLLAWGGDLDPVRLSNAYHRGIFPWYSEDQPILWWSPATRCVIFPAEVHVSRRLQRVIAQGRYTLSADQAFKQVMLGCAMPREEQEDTWITPAMIQAYTLLHRMGIAHSIEVWKDGDLVGGIYGLVMGKIFFGESMYSASRDASKVALASLCHQLDAWGFALLDCQVSNPHLQSMGAVEIAREAFLSIISANVNKNSSNLSFSDAFNSAT